MKSIVVGAAVSALMLLGASGAAAQNAGLTANFGEINLRNGFTPDPYRVNVTAGGNIDGARLPGSCTGMISDAPDFEVTYAPGNGLPLVFRTLSRTDTTLLVNAPNGDWYCDDDSYGDGDAEVRFRSPQAGTYDVWIGTFGGGTAEATLLITETP